LATKLERFFRPDCTPKAKTMTVEAYRNAKEAYKVIKEAMIGV
jgi:inorganic pyrophosphatase